MKEQPEGSPGSASVLPPLRLLGYIALAALLAEAAIGVAVIGLWGADTAAKFGAGFGVVAALVSGLALAGVVYAILLQQSQLQLQSKELERQREAMYAQNRTLSTEVFESSFFRLLEFNRHAADAITAQLAGPRSERHVGLDAFRHASDELLYRVRPEMSPPPKPQQRAALVAQSFEDVCLRSEAHFGHFFRNLYHLFRFVETRAPAHADYYAKLARAQLSTAELVLLFFNCQHRLGTGMTRYVERFQLFGGMDFPEALAPYKDLFPLSAYSADEAAPGR